MTISKRLKKDANHAAQMVVKALARLEMHRSRSKFKGIAWPEENGAVGDRPFDASKKHQVVDVSVNWQEGNYTIMVGLELTVDQKGNSTTEVYRVNIWWPASDAGGHYVTSVEESSLLAALLSREAHTLDRKLKAALKAKTIFVPLNQKKYA